MEIGLIKVSLARPGGNITGVTWYTRWLRQILSPKRLELLRELSFRH